MGGGIYTKAADVGADLVGKVEAGIPEDDPRNPAVIADNVGDNVGDVAGMGADLFESYVGSIIAAIALAGTAVAAAGLTAGWKSHVALLPLVIAGGGIVASMLATFIVRSGERASFGELLWALRRGIFGAAILVLVFSFLAVWWLDLDGIIAPNVSDLDIFWCIVAGLGAGVIIGVGTEYYTSYDYSPTKNVAESAETGVATTIISGLASGMQSTLLPLLMVVGAILAVLRPRRFLRSGHGGRGDAFHARHHASHRRLRPRGRQCRRNSGAGPTGPRGPSTHRRPRRLGQHHRRHRQGFRHRFRRPHITWPSWQPTPKQ